MRRSAPILWCLPAEAADACIDAARGKRGRKQRTKQLPRDTGLPRAALAPRALIGWDGAARAAAAVAPSLAPPPAVSIDAGARGMAAAASPSRSLPFRSYEEYLESRVTARDRHYLKSEEVGGVLVELGFRGSGDVPRREEEFEARAAAAAGLAAAPLQKSVASVGKELKDNFSRALAERGEADRTGKVSVSTSVAEDVETSGREPPPR
ncbi:LOW QUALITY PROTEIN: cilia- and flagella-associated protein 299 [Grus americana]|uniref:LOW QUALITY PROTEIN: cilia- and flagella-associated protein 299 n=1 Tax=Grus americana TaxID=9117 RepID=UPI0024087EEF|nr:LOW QUALITY PROTEIN: cilia- and flagella-associated protein 299 [Grus americana]